MTEFDPDTKSFEIDIIFKHFDVNGFGQITKENFVDGFTRTLGSIESKKFEVDLNDVIKPLMTRIRKQSKTVFQLFTKYDTDQSGLLTVQEFQRAIFSEFGYRMEMDELDALERYFSSISKVKGIRKQELADLLERGTV